MKDYLIEIIEDFSIQEGVNKLNNGIKKKNYIIKWIPLKICRYLGQK